MKQIVVNLLISLLMAISAGTVAADIEKEKNDHVDGMVLKATRSREKLIDASANVEVISRDMIQQSGALNLGDLIEKYTTGLLHNSTGSNYHGDDLKGYVLMVDGHRMGSGNVEKMDINRIEKVELIKSSSSQLYGSASMGGVINVITRKISEKTNAASARDAGGSDSIQSGFISGGSINDRFGFDVAANQNNVDGNISFDPGGNQMFRLGFDWADQTEEYSSWGDGHNSGHRYDDNDKSHRFVDLEYNTSFLNGKLRWRTMFYSMWDKYRWTYENPASMLEQSKYTETTLGSDHRLTYKPASWNKLLVGFNLGELEKESETLSRDQQSLPFTPPTVAYDNRSLFIKDSMNFMDKRLNVVVGAQYDNYNLTTTSPYSGYFTDVTERTENFDHISPKANVSMKFFDEMLKLRSNVRVGFKAPSADQLSAMYTKNSQGASKRYMGNPDLDPETVLTWNAGFDLNLGAADIGVTWFRTDYEDKIVRSTVEYGGEKWSSWTNRADKELQGFDLNLKLNISELLEWEPRVTLYSNMAFDTNHKDKDSHGDMFEVSDYEIKLWYQLKSW